ncbi:hypothetical protein ACTA71_006519 [Dictyostelium dimigraforme]
MILKYLENPNYSNQENSPLSIILGFAGGSEKLLTNYSKLWLKRGFNCLILCQNNIEFSSYFYTDYSLKIVNFIENYIKNKNKNQIICFHSLSIGATLFSCFLKYIQDNKQYSYIIKLIKGTVYDSAPLINEKHYLCAVNNINQHSIGIYTEKSLQYFNECWKYQSEHFYPYLISPINKWHHFVITSPNDLVTISIDTFLEQLITNNKSIIPFSENEINNNNQYYLYKKVFNSDHCCHLLTNPKEYQDSINKFIDLFFLNSKL